MYIIHSLREKQVFMFHSTRVKKWDIDKGLSKWRCLCGKIRTVNLSSIFCLFQSGEWGYIQKSKSGGGLRWRWKSTPWSRSPPFDDANGDAPVHCWAPSQAAKERWQRMEEADTEIEQCQRRAQSSECQKYIQRKYQYYNSVSLSKRQGVLGNDYIYRVSQ